MTKEEEFLKIVNGYYIEVIAQRYPLLILFKDRNNNLLFTYNTNIYGKFIEPSNFLSGKYLNQDWPFDDDFYCENVSFMKKMFKKYLI